MLELIDVTATGLFDQTLFGTKVKETPEQIDVLSSGSLSPTLVDSNVDVPEDPTNLYKKVRPAGVKNILKEPGVQEELGSTGGSAEDLMDGLLKKAPANVDGFGDMFDSGDISFMVANSQTDRLVAAIPKQSYDFLDNDDFKQCMAMTKEATQMLNKDTNVLGELCASNKVSRANNSSRKGNDQGAIMGFISSVLSSITKCDKQVALGNTLSTLGEKLGLDPSNSDVVSKIAAKHIAKTGGFKQVQELTNSVGLDKFGIDEKKSIASNIVGNIEIPESLKVQDRKGYSEDLVGYLGTLDPSWDSKKVNGTKVKDMEKLNNGSNDFKSLMLSNDTYSSLIAGTMSKIMGKKG